MEKTNNEKLKDELEAILDETKSNIDKLSANIKEVKTDYREKTQTLSELKIYKNGKEFELAKIELDILEDNKIKKRSKKKTEDE